MFLLLLVSCTFTTLDAAPAQATAITAVELAGECAAAEDDPYDPCCKHCGQSSKPCGDSCIANDKECHKEPGCACY